MAKCVITGGCGFLGRNVAKEVLAQGTEVLLVDDLSTGLPLDLWLPLEFRDSCMFWQGDCRDPNLSNVITRFCGSSLLDQFFHFAAIVGGRKKIEHEPLTVSQNLSIDLAAITLATKVPVQHFVYPSSSAVYPIAYQTESSAHALVEEDVQADTFAMPDQTYGWSKLTGEMHAQILYKHYGVPTTIVRPFSGYGPDQAPSYPIPAIAKRFAERLDPIEVWGTGEQRRDFIHVQDLVKALMVAMDKFPNADPVNIGSGISTSFLEVLDQFSNICRYSPEVKTRPNLPTGVHNRFANIEKIKSVGWVPMVSLRDGLSSVLDAIQNPKD
ncbi:MAG: NAD-dependent epimerase/dehydratase family protein [Saprospiraceae bacterium]|nr:NAD-dependent epimerase/dehydratase family protein [Saprospiraceae bacterium]